MGCAMAYDDVPDEVSLRFRVHVLCVYAQSTLHVMDEIAAEGVENLDEETLKIYDALAHECERIWVEAVKIKKRARG
jgi:hypothetical protein